MPLANGEEPNGKKTNLTYDEALDLIRRIEKAPVGLTDEHTAQGLAWLRRYGKKIFPDMPEEVYGGDKFAYFTYDGEARLYHTDRGWLRATLPVWHIHTTDGRDIWYYNQAWQAGHYETGETYKGWGEASRVIA